MIVTTSRRPNVAPPKKRCRHHLVIGIAIIFSVICFSFILETQQLKNFNPKLNGQTYDTKLRGETSSVEGIVTGMESRYPRHNNNANISIWTNASTSNDRNRIEKNFTLRGMINISNSSEFGHDDSFEVASSSEEPVTTITNKNTTTRNKNTSSLTHTETNSDVNIISGTEIEYDDSFELSDARKEPVLTLLVVLSGEFGNNMFKIIRAWGIARLAEREFGLTTRLVFLQQQSRRHGVVPKARHAAEELRTCFKSPSYFRAGDFDLGRRLQEEGYFSEITRVPGTNFTLSEHSTINDLKDNLKMLSDYISEISEDIAQEVNVNTTVENGSTVPRLMVRIDCLIVFPVIDEFYDDFRETFVFDEERCCERTLDRPPGEDESVLYLRNYSTEIKKKHRRIWGGFQELDQDRISSEVVGHLKAGDKLAVLGRNVDGDSERENEDLHSIISALEAKNLTLRFSPGKSGMEDFCFLKKAKKELLGTPVSSYLLLATFLAGPSLKLTRCYQYLSPYIKSPSMLTHFHRTVGSNWTHPELRSRIRFEEYFDEVSENFTSGEGKN